MKSHRSVSRAHGSFVAGWVVLALGLSASAACGDDSSGADTINDTSDGVDSVTPDTGDASDASDTAETTTPATIVINELAAAGDPADWVELHNPGSSAVDISGWLFRDNDDTRAYTFPAGSTIPAGGYKVIERDANGFDFGLGASDSARLYDASDRLVDQTSWVDGESPIGASWGRLPNGSGPFKTLFSPTPGAANVENPAQVCPNGVREGLEVCDGSDFDGLTCEALGWGGGSLACEQQCTRISFASCTPRASGLVINEVESDDSDRIELFNGTGAEVDLGGHTLTDQGDNVYTIPIGTTIAAGAYKVFTRDVDHTFGLGDADGVTLARPNGEVIDAIAWGRGQAIPSFCRIPNATGGFRTCDNQSFGVANF